MKTTVIIIVTIALITSMDISAKCFFDKEMEYYNENISTAISQIEDGNYQDTMHLIENIENNWHSSKRKWNMLCDHAEIEQITILINSVKLNCTADSYDDVLIDLKELQCSLRFTSMRYNILLENLL